MPNSREGLKSTDHDFNYFCGVFTKNVTLSFILLLLGFKIVPTGICLFVFTSLS
jgi:hypothetical protein